jgi:hypothetical protein
LSKKKKHQQYDAVGTISTREAEDYLLQAVKEFKTEVVTWLEENHPGIYPKRG